MQGCRSAIPHSFDPDPDLIRILGFDDQKLEKIYSAKKLNIFFKSNTPYP
jgi:hypothetical protein